ncbi:hypothetical protein [Occallatibacter riparius]|uniref:Uncharacterized protein n=1 Tax=Occallatibacter riparius TaxID=1002689 RepID=A0A9J7BT65_9BACT|nr:hypothetical protein [Occallatibacter riparius]UWZ84938.1 hypothetical protein MOP44_03120 [Occallatibacter riparius]
MSEISRRTGNCLLIAALCISCGAISGCLESSFQLARESRLPKFIPIPPGLTREDISVTMNYYTALGNDAKFILKDRKGKKLAKVSGKAKRLNPLKLKSPSQFYPDYEAITANRVTDIIEHRKMEPIFYVTDDPAVWEELMRSRASHH